MNERDRVIEQWLAQRLGSAPLRLEPASEDASFRRYLRVHTGEGTWVLMDAPPQLEDCRPFLHVNRLLRDAEVHAPAVEHADPELGLVLLEDLGTTCYLDVLDEASADGLYARAIDTLISIQARVDPDAVPPFDATLLRREVDLFRDWFLARHLNLDLTRAQGATLRHAFESLVAACLQQPRVFVHRDYHSRNLMALPASGPGVIDHQDAVGGPITYDLLSLLRDVYVEWPGERVQGWMDVWTEGARAAGVVGSDSSEQLLRWFELTGVQRHLKVAGIFARLWHRDGKPRYLADIPLTLRYLRAECNAVPELAPLGALLGSLDLEARTDAANATALAAARPGRPDG